MKKQCNENCWECELEGCPYVLDVSETMNEKIISEMTYIERQKLYRMLYRESEHGKEMNRQGQRRYRKKHPQKYNKDHAKFEWIKCYKRKHGTSPTDNELKVWSFKYDERLERKKAKELARKQRVKFS